MQTPLLLTAFLLTAVSMGGVAINEYTHGDMAEMMGFGHRHMFDHGGYHCAPHDHGEHGQRHMQHMHEENHLPHHQCNGGADMHRQDTMRPGGPQA
jgi:hypothetical protein